MAVYPGMKPMLEFTRVPEQVEGRPRRRRCVVHTPKNPRVKAVPIYVDVDEPPNIKWVSPQFGDEPCRDKPSRHKRGLIDIRTGKRAVQPLRLEEEEDSPHISVYPSLAPHLAEELRSNQRSEETNDLSSDQTVPELTNSLVLPHSPRSMDYSRNTTTVNGTVPATSVAGSRRVEPTESVEEISDLVGHMSLEETPHTINPLITDNHTLTTTQGTNVGTSIQDTRVGTLIQDTHVGTWIQDTRALSSIQDNCAMTITQDMKNNNFKPPSTSTPYRYQQASHLGPLPSQGLDAPASTQPADAHSNFVLQLMDTHSEVTEGYSSSTHDGSLKEGSDFVLAPETPQHLWVSPEVKVIDNTFS